MGLVDLEVLEYGGPTRWRWRLTGPGGRFPADHEVDLDPAAAELEAFTDLHGYLRRFAAPDRRAASEAELVDRVGRWIGETVLGLVGEALAGEAPVTVRLRLPVEAGCWGTGRGSWAGPTAARWACRASPSSANPPTHRW